MINKEEAQSIFDNFNHQKALIIGDVMIDAYIWGKVERISPEAPVPIVAVTRRENLFGGAANVAINVKSLGATAILCSVIGEDDQGDLFLSLMEKENLSTAGIYRSAKRITTTKYRIIGNNAQMLRVDEEITADIPDEETNALFSKIRHIIDTDEIDVIIFQDYNKGVITEKLIGMVISLAKEHSIPVTVDPKKKNFEAYLGVTLFKPNLKEIKEGLRQNLDVKDIKQLEAAAKVLHKNQEVENVMITLSEAGIFMSSHTGNNTYETFVLPAHLRSITDVSGAGDTVISVASLCLAQKLPHRFTVAISNLAGGLVCEYVGVVPINKQRLLKETQALLS